MTILNHLKKLVAALVAPVDDDDRIDNVAYHARADERELRFSRSNVLRRYY